jgi:hypothetical protein
MYVVLYIPIPLKDIKLLNVISRNLQVNNRNIDTMQ